MVDVLGAVWAGAVHMLYGYLDWLAKQLFGDTAEREQLLREAALYGITPVPATFATGTAPRPARTAPRSRSTRSCQARRGDLVPGHDGQTIASGTATLPIKAVLAGTRRTSRRHDPRVREPDRRRQRPRDRRGRHHGRRRRGRHRGAARSVPAAPARAARGRRRSGLRGLGARGRRRHARVGLPERARARHGRRALRSRQRGGRSSRTPARSPRCRRSSTRAADHRRGHGGRADDLAVAFTIHLVPTTPTRARRSPPSSPTCSSASGAPGDGVSARHGASAPRSTRRSAPPRA
jgi:hypothetical protein